MAPTTTRMVTVTSPTEFNTAAGMSGSLVRVSGTWSTGVAVSANDVDVVLEPQAAIGSVEIGTFSNPVVSRVRVRGPVSGQRSGGRLGQLRLRDGVTDVIVDGVDLNGASNFGNPAEDNQAFRVANVNRLAVLNVRAIAGGFIWLGGGRHVVIANSNFYHGGATRMAAGYVEGWGVRNTGGPLTIVDSRIQGTRYHNLRAQSVGSPGELLYVTRTTFVAMAEGRTAWLWNNLGNGAFRGAGAILEDNDIYSYSASSCNFGAEITAPDVGYSRLRNNRFFGGGTAVNSQAQLSAASGGYSGDHDWSVGNTFAALPAQLPAWAGPGDPTTIPLPNGLTRITGEGICPAAP
ncbi:MAG: hypothetical protein SFW67_24515 [Myxococcaceae bacterium]|nr:hypothetical protein [Myxococcaceae bacterium]